MSGPNYKKDEIIPDDVYIEWHKKNFKPFARDEIFAAIALEANKVIKEITNDYREITTQDVNTAWNSSKKGAPVGAKKPFNATLLVHGPNYFSEDVINLSTGQPARYEDGTKYEIRGEYYNATMGAWNYDPIKKEGSPRIEKLRFGHHLKGSSSNYVPPTKSQEEVLKEAEQLYIGELSTRASGMREMLDLVAQDIWKFEAEEIKENQPSMQMEVADAFYPRKKHPSASREHLNKVYGNAYIVPDDYQPFNTNDNYRIRNELNNINIQTNPLEWHEKSFEITRDKLESGIAQLKYMDYTGENKLVAAYEEKFGTVRDINEREEQRINSTMRKKYTEKELFEKAADGEDITRNVKNVSGKKLILPAVQTSDLGNPDAIPKGMQLFTNSDKRTGAGLSTANCVYPVAGDFTKEPDYIVYGEGGATVASLAQEGEHVEEFKGKNVWYIAAFDADNLIKVGKEMVTRFPDATHIVHGDNDTHVYAVKDLPENKGDKTKKFDRTPILDKNGEYQYIANDNQSLLRKDQLHESRAKQFFQLKENKGATVVRELNLFFSENGIQKEDGSFIKPKLVAFVTNNDLNKTVTDYLWQPKKLVGDLPRPNSVPPEQAKLNYVAGKTHGDANDWLEGMVATDSAEKFVSLMYANQVSRISEAQKREIYDETVANASKLFFEQPMKIAEQKFSMYYDKQLSSGNIKPIDPADIPKFSQDIDVNVVLDKLNVNTPERGTVLSENAQKIKEQNEREIKEAEERIQAEQADKNSGGYGNTRSNYNPPNEAKGMHSKSDFGFGGTSREREEYQQTQEELNATAKIDAMLAQLSDEIDDVIPIVSNVAEKDAQLEQQQANDAVNTSSAPRM